jgi:hypothetical protein
MKRGERTRSSTLSVSSSPSSQNCSYAFWWQLFCEEFFVDAASILFLGKGLLDDEDYFFAKESDHKILVFRSVCKKELIDSGMLWILVRERGAGAYEVTANWVLSFLSGSCKGKEAVGWVVSAPPEDFANAP